MEQDRWINEPEKKEKKSSKAYIWLGVVLIVVIGLLFLLNKKSKVELLSLDKAAVTLNVGETDRLTVTIKPEDLNPVLHWESSDENIAKVMDGIVTAEKTGSVVIKVSVRDQKEMFAICEYTIIEPDIDMETLDILEEPIVLRPGGHQQLTVNFTPENQNEMISWSSTNESVAKVSPRGKVEAIRVGLAYVIAKSERTGVADTAAVSVEGTGVTLEKEMPQVQNPQTATKNQIIPKEASKQSVTVTPKATSANTAKSTSTQTSVASKAVVPKPTKTATTKSTSTVASKPVQSSSSKNSKDFGYAVFKGTWPNDVKGRMDFKNTHVIDSRDPKRRIASPGDYVIGEWSDGHLVQGIWYGSDNQAKGSILIGK